MSRVPLYGTHVPTSTLQKVLLAAGSSAVALLRPQRGDMVATCGEVLGAPTLQKIKSRMECDPVGQKILSEQPRVTNDTVDINFLRSLPDRTFGREYCRFLDKLNTGPDERPPVQFIDDLEIVYVMQRYRETHDFYHTLLEMPTTILGEVVVKWFEGIQLGLPMCVFGGIFGAVRLFPKQRRNYIEHYLPWIVQNAQQSTFFMNVYWEKHWEEPIGVLQTKLNITPPPNVVTQKL